MILASSNSFERGARSPRLSVCFSGIDSRGGGSGDGSQWAVGRWSVGRRWSAASGKK